MSAGVWDSAKVSASRPVGATLTSYPALRRYIATNEAIDASSSTTSTVCASGDAIAPLRIVPAAQPPEGSAESSMGSRSSGIDLYAPIR